jgi:ferredoxin/flavodoxin---NADP+ reductase
MAAPGNTDLRVAVVGLGRTEAHAAGYLLANADLGLRVDVLETRPGVARNELLALYQAVVYILGEPATPALSIPGAELAGCTTATGFADWLRGRGGDDIDLGCRRAVLIGDNDRALDLARTLAGGSEPPGDIDVSGAAGDALARSALEEIVITGRAGPEQAAFTPGALRALSADAQVVADASELAVPEPYRERVPDQRTRDNLALLSECAGRPRGGDGRRVALRFLLAPTRILGAGRVQAIELVRTALERDADGRLHAQATDARATIPAGLVVSAERRPERPIPPGVPVNAEGAIMADEHGRVIDADGRPTGEYVGDGSAVQAVRILAHDVASGRLAPPA